MTSSSVKFTFPSFDDIIRIKRDDGGVDIFLDGELLTTIEPVTRKRTPEEIEAHLRRIDELTKIITENWSDPTLSAVDAVREQRRNLTPDEWVDPDWRADS